MKKPEQPQHACQGVFDVAPLCLAQIASTSPLVSALGGPASSPTSGAPASGVSKNLNSSSMAWFRKDTAHSVPLPLLPGARLTSVWHPTTNNWWRYPGSCFFQAAQHPAHHLRFKQSRAVPFGSRPSGQLVMPHPCTDQTKTERSEHLNAASLAAIAGPWRSLQDDGIQSRHEHLKAYSKQSGHFF